MASFSVFFFFQAEDGIRDLTVTGVQTCALPISLAFQAQELLRRELEGLIPRGLAERLVPGRRGRDPVPNVQVHALQQRQGPHPPSPPARRGPPPPGFAPPPHGLPWPPPAVLAPAPPPEPTGPLPLPPPSGPPPRCA